MTLVLAAQARENAVSLGADSQIRYLDERLVRSGSSAINRFGTFCKNIGVFC